MEVGRSLNFMIKMMRNVEKSPALISGIVTSFTDVNQEPPKTRDASSSSGLICLRELLINKNEMGKPLTMYPIKKIHNVPYKASGGEEKQMIKPNAKATAGKDMALVLRKERIFLPGIVVLSTIQAMMKEKIIDKAAAPIPNIKLFFKPTIKSF